MKYILLSIFTIGILTSCDPKSNYIDTGISNGKHDCSMLEYFHTSSYNWDSLLVMIQHAELESLFEGREPCRYPARTVVTDMEDVHFVLKREPGLNLSGSLHR